MNPPPACQMGGFTLLTANLSLQQGSHKIQEGPRDTLPVARAEVLAATARRDGSMGEGVDPAPQSAGDSIDHGKQRIARMVLAAALFLLGLWILHRYLT